MNKKAYFDERAAKWDSLIQDEVILRLKAMVKDLSLSQGSKVLDLGTGTGVLIPLLIEAVGVSGTVVAVDFAPRMLAEARKKYCWPNLKVIEGCAEGIPLVDQTVDEVVCNSAFPHFDDLWQAAKEMNRVLKKGGRVSVFHPHSRNFINELHRSLGSAVRNCMLPETNVMYDIFSEAGFKNIVIKDMPQQYLLTARKIQVRELKDDSEKIYCLFKNKQEF